MCEALIGKGSGAEAPTDYQNEGAESLSQVLCPLGSASLSLGS